MSEVIAARSLESTYTPTTLTEEEFVATNRYGVIVSFGDDRYVSFRGPTFIISHLSHTFGCDVEVVSDRIIRISQR